MRLIDADAVLQGIEELKRSPYATDGNALERLWIKDTLEIVADLCVKQEPTAYDIDKVVEQLKEATYYDESGVHTIVGSGRAIGIVEAGGKE